MLFGVKCSYICKEMRDLNNLLCAWASNGSIFRWILSVFTFWQKAGDTCHLGLWYLFWVFNKKVKSLCLVLVHHCEVFRPKIMDIFSPTCFPVLCRSHCFGNSCYYWMLHSVQFDQYFFAVYPWNFWVMLSFLTPYWKPKFLHLSFIWCLTTVCPVFVEWWSFLMQGIEYFRDMSYLDCI
jgi:hypothetical protein